MTSIADGPSLLRGAVEITSAARAACGTSSVVALFILQLLVAVTDGFTLLLLVPVINGIQADGSVAVSSLGISVSVWVALAALVVVIAVKACFSWGSSVLGNSIRWRTSDAMRIEALDALLHAEWRYLATQRRSHLVQNLTADIMRINTASAQLITMTVGVLMAIAMAVVSVVLSPLIGTVAIVAAVLVAGASVRNVRRSGELGVQTNTRIKAFGAAVTDSLASVRLIRANEASDVWMSTLEDEAADGRAVQSRFARTSATLRSGLSIASAIGLVLLVGLGLWLGLTSAILIALVVVVSRMLSTVLGLIQQAQIYANSAPAVDRVLSVTREADNYHEQRALDARTDSAQAAEPDPSTTKALLRFADVTVEYDTVNEPALKRVSFELTEGTVLAIVGPSGAGKSTLLDVVLGLTPPSSGEVAVHGRPLTDFAAWRSEVAYVPQEVVLIPGTVRRNLTWTLQAGRTVTDDQLWNALRIAEVDAVVHGLADGLDTNLSETVGLSGGEKQRLTIARALARSPRLLVLDEATSALDSGTEAALLEGLRQLETTVLMVTHRADMAAQADRVLTLANGHVVSAGADSA